MTLAIDFTNMMVGALPNGAGISDSQWEGARAAFVAAHAAVQSKRSSLGFLTLPTNEAMLNSTLAVAENAKGRFTDVLLLGKALGGGMPLGAFVADGRLMNTLTYNPVLGHITTFGGHPVSCAAGMAALNELIRNKWMCDVKAKEELFVKRLQHPKIKEIRSAGLWMALEFDSFETCKSIIDRCIENGIVTDWFLFAPNCLRIAPPLIISFEEIEMTCGVILECMN